MVLLMDHMVNIDPIFQSIRRKETNAIRSLHHPDTVMMRMMMTEGGGRGAEAVIVTTAATTVVAAVNGHTGGVGVVAGIGATTAITGEGAGVGVIAVDMIAAHPIALTLPVMMARGKDPDLEVKARVARKKRERRTAVRANHLQRRKVKRMWPRKWKMRRRQCQRRQKGSGNGYSNSNNNNNNSRMRVARQLLVVLPPPFPSFPLLLQPLLQVAMLWPN